MRAINSEKKNELVNPGPIKIALVMLIIISFYLVMCTPQRAPKPKIVYVNSYHKGHPSSDAIMDAIINSFPADSFELSVHLMDTKRNTSVEFIQKRAEEIYNSIVSARTDLLIVSDDNAMKYLVKPFHLDDSIPTVFCGINMSADQYDLNYRNVTGIIEMLPFTELLSCIEPYYPDLRNLLVLSENTTSSQKEVPYLDTMISERGIQPFFSLTNNFDEWLEIFKNANQQYDAIYIVTHAAIKGWDHDKAVEYVGKHVNKPVLTCENFMMPYSVIGLTKVPAEHGLWAANTGGKILNGENPAGIPVIVNQLSELWLNQMLAAKIGFSPETKLLDRAHIIQATLKKE